MDNCYISEEVLHHAAALQREAESQAAARYVLRDTAAGLERSGLVSNGKHREELDRIERWLLTPRRSLI
jgi:hypothetical protein